MSVTKHSITSWSLVVFKSWKTEESPENPFCSGSGNMQDTWVQVPTTSHLMLLLYKGEMQE